MNYILIHWSYGRVSTRMAVDAMEQPCRILAKKNSGEWMHYHPESKEWTIFYGINEIFSDEKNNIINWGNHIFANDVGFRLNVPSAIALACNKRLSRRILQNAGVAVPYTVFSARANDYESMKYPVIMRPAYHHGGKNFDVFQTFQGLLPRIWGFDSANFYVSEVFPKTHEYRVHVAHGKVLFINDKPLIEGELRANHAINHQAWRALKWHEFNPKICQESIKAVEELGLDYGAVDIMHNVPDNSVAICEVNTSPSIDTEYSSKKYATYFDWVIRHNFPPHFALEEGTNVFYTNLLRM